MSSNCFTCMIRWLIALSAMIAMLPIPTSALASDSPGEIVKSASAALKAGEYEHAIELYEKARELLPQSPEIAYNLGVAHYRKGDFQNAADAFSEASSLSSDGSLRSRSIYNIGNAAYAQSLNALKNQSDPTQSQERLQQATDLLKGALDNYKKAISADPTDEDARANAELSHRFLKQLQQMQQQMQQHQQSQQNEQDQQNQQEQQSQPSQSDQQQQQQPSSEQEDQSQQQQQSDQQPQSSEGEQQEQNAQEQPDAEIEPVNEQPPQDQGKHVQHPAEQKDKTTMSRKEAERLLQSVRDKERKRRTELLRREAAKYAPAEKDW
jgi:Ca-activated chloride channel homolog